MLSFFYLRRSRLPATLRCIRPIASKSLPIRTRLYSSATPPPPPAGKDSTLTTLRRGLWRIVRVVFLVTGGLVWIAIWMNYASVRGGGGGATTKRGFNFEQLGGADCDAMRKKFVRYFDVSEDKISMTEVGEKINAVLSLWEKLKEEDRIVDSLGSGSYICGFDLRSATTDSSDKYREEINDVEGKRWKSACYVEGPLGVARLETEFWQHDDEKWVPLAVRLEVMETSGNCLADVSAFPPNGLTKYTRLSKL